MLSWKKETNRGKWEITIVLPILIFLVIIIIALSVSLAPKKEPDITIEQGIDEIILNINCNDNYNYVIVEITLFDINKNMIDSFNLRADNLKNGETKQLTHKLSIEDMLQVKSIKYEILEYK